MEACSSIHLNDLLMSLSRALDYVEQEVFSISNNHSKRVALLSMRMCQALGHTQEEVLDMASCAMLHDVALTKYAKQFRQRVRQSAEDFNTHCIMGEGNTRHFPFLKSTKGIILHHHENWNGTGFFGARQDDMNPRATVLRLADAMDTSFANQFDTPELSLKPIQTHIQRNSGSLYSPRTAEALLDICDIPFLEDLQDEHINTKLKEEMPNIATPMSLDALLAICKVFSKITDVKSCFTATHSQGVASTTAKLTKAWNLTPNHAKRVMIAAHLHDIGKLTVHADILEKPDSLTPEEAIIMQSHVKHTADLLLSIHGFEEIATWASSHHEKLNGKGYPQGITGDKLSFESRLLACSDIYQALIEDRPYRAGMTHAKSMKILQTMVTNNELDADIVKSMHAVLDPDEQVSTDIKAPDSKQ